MKSKVLVIEDNELNLELVTDLLEVHGFMVLQARTAEEGLRLARESQPEVVLMDLSLPGMDGLAATRVLRQDPLNRNVKIVALTAHAMRGDQETALAAGFDLYVTKPINTVTFPSMVAELIPPHEPLTIHPFDAN